MSTAFPRPNIEKGLPGLLLVGHGTRDPLGLAEFRTVAQCVTELAGDFIVESCFLELAEPDISKGVELLLKRGVRRLTVAPVLLFAAGHAKRDIPAAVERAVQGFGLNPLKETLRGSAGGSSTETQWQTPGDGRRREEGGQKKAEPELALDQLGTLECNSRILELSIQRFQEALANRPHFDANDTMLLMVARGSSDPQAIAAMHRFAEQRQQKTPVGQADSCFAAVAEPTLQTGLQNAARSKYRRIVVQPHLLFAGQVLDEIREAVNEISGNISWVKNQTAGIFAEKEWIVTKHLGASPLVAQAVLELARGRMQACTGGGETASKAGN